MTGPDGLFGEDPEVAKLAEEFERHGLALYERVCAYMDEAEIGEAFVAALLLDAAIKMRMAAYGMGVENPSVAGLKLDLDRLRREVDDVVHQTKTGAEDYIRLVKQARAEAELEDKRE
jgi:hypothetical protein